MNTPAGPNVDYQIVALDPGSPNAQRYAHWIEDEWVREPICDWLESGTALGTFGDVTIPIVCAAVTPDDELLAAASIVLDEMLDRPQWNPWLGLVYVAEPYRSHGIGRAIVAGLIDAADAAGIAEVYLFCPPRLEAFYREFGFEPIETREYDGVYAITLRRRRP